MKRRGYTKKLICDRTGFDNKTVNKVFAGDPGVAIGTYLKVMAVLGMEENFAEMAAHDEVGVKLQNIKLLEGSQWTADSKDFLDNNNEFAAPPMTSLRELEYAAIQIEKDDNIDSDEYYHWLKMLTLARGKCSATS